jgi:hypothetical protein
LLERDSFDLFLPEFDKPWVIHLRETCCCSINLFTWRPNTVYKNRRVRRHQPPQAWGNRDGRSRGNKAPKKHVKCDALTLALQETLKRLLAEKKMSSAKRVERRCREKGKMKDFLEVKKRKIKIDETNA